MPAGDCKRNAAKNDPAANEPNGRVLLLQLLCSVDASSTASF